MSQPEYVMPSPDGDDACICGCGRGRHLASRVGLACFGYPGSSCPCRNFEPKPDLRPRLHHILAAPPWLRSGARVLCGVDPVLVDEIDYVARTVKLLSIQTEPSGEHEAYGTVEWAALTAMPVGERGVQ